MIKNQNKQDDQYFLLMHVYSRLSKSPGPLMMPGGSEPWQSGQCTPRRNSGTPALGCAFSAPSLVGQGQLPMNSICPR